MTNEELTQFLKERTNGMACPVCGSFDWYVRSSDRNVKLTNLVDGGLEQKIDESLFDLIVEFGGIPPSIEDTEENPEKEILYSVIMLRCNHCGHLEFFDGSFVEEQIHGEK